MKLLLIAPIFFDYEVKIQKALQSQYHKVIFRAEIPFNSSFIYYALRRLSKSTAYFFLLRYNKQLLKLIENEKIDKIFIIRGFGLDESFFNNVRLGRKNIKIYHYQWDSLKIFPNGKMISKYADYNFSFDLEDVNSNKRFKHLPLFYLSSENKKYSKNNISKVDLLFIGSFHSSRNEIVTKADTACKKQGLVFKSHIYMPFFSYLRALLTNNSVNFKDVSFRKISYNKYEEMLDKTKVVLDIPYAQQKGATMRTIETLSKGKKLVSTNKMLQSELFYSFNNIHIWNIDDELDLKGIISSDFDHSKDKYLYSLDEWLKQIGVLNT
jgi:hypothetical protein